LTEEQSPAKLQSASVRALTLIIKQQILSSTIKYFGTGLKKPKAKFVVDYDLREYVFVLCRAETPELSKQYYF
jgi:hypothetical protein